VQGGKPIDDFSPKGSRGGRDSYCRPCRRAYGQDHYAANGQRYIDQTRLRNDRYFRERVLFLLEYFKSHPCSDCGETDPVVLEFDHLRDKEFDIASGIHYRAWERVLAEIAKCELVCANCHRRRTARRRGALRLVLSEGGR
jgi:5-methylcytosine-specific restriction endonuclease McrA